MKRSFSNLSCAALAFVLPAMSVAQDARPVPVPRPMPPPGATPVLPAAPVASVSGFSKFDLDFPGGPPELLVELISKANGHPLNVIIPEEVAETIIPPIKLRNVTVPQVFNALAQASRKDVARISGYNPVPPGSAASPIYQVHTTSYGFFTQGEANPDSVWCFRAERPAVIQDPPPPPVRPKTCRFFQLGPYLDDYKVEDITTAVETAWKMLGKTNEDQPEMKFHSDTKLLIVVGPEEKVTMIDAVLRSLTPGPPMIDPATGLPVGGPRPGRPPRPLGPPPRQ